jgi:hypothetical protein
MPLPLAVSRRDEHGRYKLSTYQAVPYLQFLIRILAILIASELRFKCQH